MWVIMGVFGENVQVDVDQFGFRLKLLKWEEGQNKNNFATKPIPNVDLFPNLLDVWSVCRALYALDMLELVPLATSFYLYHYW